MFLRVCLFVCMYMCVFECICVCLRVYKCIACILYKSLFWVCMCVFECICLRVYKCIACKGLHFVLITSGSCQKICTKWWRLIIFTEKYYVIYCICHLLQGGILYNTLIVIYYMEKFIFHRYLIISSNWNQLLLKELCSILANCRQSVIKVEDSFRKLSQYLIYERV